MSKTIINNSISRVVHFKKIKFFCKNANFVQIMKASMHNEQRVLLWPPRAVRGRPSARLRGRSRMRGVHDRQWARHLFAALHSGPQHITQRLEAPRQAEARAAREPRVLQSHAHILPRVALVRSNVLRPRLRSRRPACGDERLARARAHRRRRAHVRHRAEAASRRRLGLRDAHEANDERWWCWWWWWQWGIDARQRRADGAARASDTTACLSLWHLSRPGGRGEAPTRVARRRVGRRAPTHRGHQSARAHRGRSPVAHQRCLLRQRARQILLAQMFALNETFWRKKKGKQKIHYHLRWS